MGYRGVMRKIETATVDVTGAGLEDLAAQFEKERPEGFQLETYTVSMPKGSPTLDAHGTYARRDQTQELRGDTTDAIRAQVPEGWQLLFVAAE